MKGSTHLTLSYSSEIKRLKGFSALEKKPSFVIRGLCCPYNQVQQPAADNVTI